MATHPRILSLICVILGTFSPHTGANQPPHYAPDRLVDILHVTIEVVPDFVHHTVSGNTRITLTPIAKPLTELKLNATRLDVFRVWSDASIDDWSQTDTHITVTFDPPLIPGQKIFVAVLYEAEPDRGLYFRTAQNGYAAEDTHLFTQGEAHEAQHWYPNYDYPNERFTSEVICSVPPNMTVLSNGRKLSEAIDPNTGLKTVHWRQDQPHVNYLIALVAGYFKGIGEPYKNIPMAFYTPVSMIDLAENSFKDTADMMAFFEADIGIPYPWDKYDQVAVIDFVAGGMENTSLTVLTHRTLHPAELEPVHSSTPLVAHELAHQWFGDYVTCKDWSHLWLNEGFATYYENLYSRHKHGEREFLYNMYSDARRIFRGTADQEPIVHRTYQEPDDQFDVRAYQKGGWVLHMLRSQLGEDLFRRCIKTYLERHALSTVETTDLRLIIEELSGRSFDRFFDQWVFNGGHPKLNIQYEWLPKNRLAKVTITQQHIHGPESGGRIFVFPAQLRFRMGEQTINHDILIDQAEHDFYVALPAEPDIVRFDPDYTILAEVDFRKPTPMLYEQLADHNDIIGQIRAMQSLQEKNDKKTVNQLKQVLNQAPFYGARQEAATALRRIHTDEAFAALTDSLDQADLRVRNRVVQSIGLFYRNEAKDILLNVAREQTNPDIAASALDSLGRYHDPNVKQVLIDALSSHSFRQIRANGAIRGIRSLKDTSLVPDLLETINRRKDRLASEAFSDIINILSALAECAVDLDDKTEVRQCLADRVNHPKLDIQIAALRGLGTLGDPKAIGIVEPFADKQSDRLQRVAQRALEKLQEQTPLVVPDEVIELRKSVDELKEKNQDLQQQLDDIQQQLEALSARSDTATAPEEDD